jgi:hypothetical protein
MRTIAVAVAALALQSAGFKATLTAGGHAPVINKRWPYSVKVDNSKGKPLAARITVAVVDPIGIVHPVEFFSSKKTVTNIPFKGTFREAVLWPIQSKGYTLTFRVTVRIGAAKRVLRYAVTPT